MLHAIRALEPVKPKPILGEDQIPDRVLGANGNPVAIHVSQGNLKQIGSGEERPNTSVELVQPLVHLVTPPEITQTERLRRTQLVLEHFGIELETTVPIRVDDLDGCITVDEIHERLQYIDPQGELLGHYAEITTDALGFSVLRVYRDRDSKERLDFEVRLAGQPVTPDNDVCTDSFPTFADLAAPVQLEVSDNVAQPLLGKRIAIDPGHMGGEWADITGKYIESRGRRLSEGELAGKTAELLAERLRELGAEVMITRTGKNPVTTTELDDIDIRAGGRETLAASTGTTWFQELLKTPGDDETLLRTFERSSHVKKMFASIRRGQYFNRSDLNARAKNIRDFGADITLSLHFDVATSGHSVNPAAPSQTKVYVPGGIMAGELSTREDRAYYARHLFGQDWAESVELSRSVVQSISKELDIPLQTGHGNNAAKIEDGVFARNLGLLRKVPDTAFVFVEALYYNRPDEFNALMRADNARIQQLVDAIADGIVAHSGKAPPT